MIKVFSPEAFKDYAIDSIYYSCISSPVESKWFISKSDLQNVIQYSYHSYVNSTYASVDEFFSELEAEEIIIKGDNLSEILDYDKLITKLRSWFTMRTTYEYFLDCHTFRYFMKVNGYGIVDTFLHNLAGSRVIDGYDGQVKINSIDNFRNAIVNDLRKDGDEYIDPQEANDLIFNTESGVSRSEELYPTLYYIFILASNREEFKVLSESDTYIYDHNNNDKPYDTGDLYSQLHLSTLEGYRLFGIKTQQQTQHYFNYTKFAQIMADKDVGDYTPQQFVNDMVNRTVLKIVKGNYRVVNLDVLKSQYSLYCIGVNYNSFENNGDVVILPESTVESVELNGIWELNVTVRIDEEGTSNYIQKGCVISVPFRVFREQQFPYQLWRVYNIDRNFDTITCVGYPVAQESKFECPVNMVFMDNKNAQEVANALTGMYPEKYAVETDISNGRTAIYAENSNMQEMIAGNDEATFLNVFGGDLVYDNYIYRIKKRAGLSIDDAGNYLIQYRSNMKGITISENTFDIVTRIYPTSQDGYDFNSVQAAMQQYTNLYGEFSEKVVDYWHFSLLDLAGAVEDYDNTNNGAGTDIGLQGEFGPSQGTGPDGEITTSPWSDHVGVTTNAIAGYESEGPSQKVTDEVILFALALLDKSVITVKDISGNPVDHDMLVEFMGLINNMPLDHSYRETNQFIVYMYPNPNVVITSVDMKGAANSTYSLEFAEELARLRTNLSAGKFVKTVYKRVYTTDTKNIPKYIDAPNIDDYPFVHASSIKYDIPLIDTTEETNDAEIMLNQDIVKSAVNAIKTKTDALSKSYIKLARKGEWNHKKRIKVKSKTVTHNDYEYMHTKPYNPRKDRVALPYGYIFYSFKDSIEYLKQEAVLSWCSNEDEAALFCQAIEDGFAWCGKTNIAKWSWHTNKNGQYYGTKNRSDYVRYAYHNIGNVMYWFSYGEDKANGSHTGGYIKKKLLDYEDYKWVETQVELTEEEKKAISEQKKQEQEEGTYDEKKYRVYPYKEFKYMNSDGKYMTNCWIEESATKHYHVNGDGWRDIEDDEEWTFRKGSDGNTYRLTGWHYGNFEKGYYPVEKQYMYIKEKKAWYYFKKPGIIQGLYMSNENWKWKKYKKGWRYTDGHGEYLWGQWAKINSKWYWFDEHGYADETTDDFDANAKSFNTVNKHPETDYNREGVGTISSSTDTQTTQTGETFSSDRDGVKAWIQAQFIKDLKKEILNQHFKIWDNLRSRLWNAAVKDINELRNESICVEVDFVDLRNYEGYEEFKFLEDLYLGDYVHVKSSYHNYDGYLRVVAMSVDCTTGQKQSMTLGYPVNSFIKRTAKLNKAGTVKFYSPNIGIEDGYGGYIDTGYNTKITSK